MARGKQTCKILKEIRKQIAAENDIHLVIEECTYQGDCLGTCPQCEAEVRYLERELEKRQRMGKAAVFAGMSMGTLLSIAACGSTSDATKSSAKGSDGTEVAQTDTIERELEGLVKMNQYIYAFDSVYFQKAMKDKFRDRGMEDLTIVSGEVLYGTTSRGEYCKNLDEVVEAARDFGSPYYKGKEPQLRNDIATLMKEDASKYSGDVEVEFTVDFYGKVKDVVIVKGLDPALDDDIVSVFEQLEWGAGDGRLNNHENVWLGCRCIKKLHFPIIIEGNRVKPMPNPEIDMLEGKPPVRKNDRDQ